MCVLSSAGSFPRHLIFLFQSVLSFFDSVFVTRLSFFTFFSLKYRASSRPFDVLSLSHSHLYSLSSVRMKRELLSRARARATTWLAGNDVIINGLVSISRRLCPRSVVSFKSVHAALQISLFLSPLLSLFFPPILSSARYVSHVRAAPINYEKVHQFDTLTYRRCRCHANAKPRHHMPRKMYTLYAVERSLLKFFERSFRVNGA